MSCAIESPAYETFEPTPSSRPTLLGVTARVILPLIMLIIGSVHINNCPVNPHIPEFLVVAGVLMIVRIIMATTAECIWEGEDRLFILKCVLHTIDLFLFIWFIAGSVWTYSVYQPYYEDRTANEYCNSFLYLFTFCYLTIVYIFIGVLLVNFAYRRCVEM